MGNKMRKNSQKCDQKIKKTDWKIRQKKKWKKNRKSVQF